MSSFGEMKGKARKVALRGGLDSLPNGLHVAMVLEANKPDSKDLHDLDSPISPLRMASTIHTSSSSSFSNSLSVNLHLNAASVVVASGRRRHWGELSGSSETSLVAVDGRSKGPGQRLTGSSPLIYSGDGGTASSAMTNVLPLGKMGKTRMMARSSARSDLLRSGMGTMSAEV